MYLLYYLPIGTEVRLRRVPWVTLLLMALNLACFLVFRFDPKGYVLINAWALVPNQPSLLNAVMANFLHASWGHLIGNMLYLWLFGAPVEDRTGPVRMLLSYLLCGMFALLAHSWFVLAITPQQQGIAVLGASGAVSGVTGMFLVRFYYVRVRVGIPAMLLLRGIRRGSQVYLPALAAIAIWSGIQLASGMIDLVQRHAGTAYAAHVAGLVMGLGMGYGFGLHRGAHAERLRTLADRCFRQCEWYLAQEAYARYLALAPADTTARLQLARAHMLTRQEAAAAREYAIVVRHALEARDGPQVRDAYLEVRRLLPLAGLPLSLQRAAAETLEATGYYFEAAEAWERYGRLEPQAARAVPALFRAARLAHAQLGDVARARDLYQAVLTRFPGSEATEVARERLRRLEEQEKAALAPPAA
ncbi:MAG TPA: rhomboid family intramembrane serine protease [Candidatus Saccharimonadales bacterium]|nr:rhomboid family intramembrane serine protease [Candidatus Saccharimonadales bacterium]